MKTTNSNTDLIARAYEAPESRSVPERRPLGVKFWFAVALIVLGNIVFTTTLLMMYHLPFWLTFTLLCGGIALAWSPNLWLVPASAPIVPSVKQKNTSAVGFLVPVAFMLIMLGLYPTANFSRWTFNPMMAPFAWLMINNSCLQIAALIGRRDASLEGV